MIRISRKLALAASLTAIVLGVGTGIAFADDPENDTDNINPANTSFTRTHSENITFTGTINFISVTVTCTKSTITGTTPAHGLGPVNITPSFTGCTDTLGGNDTITPHGQWTLTFIDKPNDENIVIGNTIDEPPGHGGHTEDMLQVTIPKDGATFTSTANNCVITATPNGAANIFGTYDDVNKLTFSSASVPVSGNTCFANSTAVSGTYTVTPNIQDVSS